MKKILELEHISKYISLSYFFFFDFSSKINPYINSFKFICF